MIYSDKEQFSKTLYDPKHFTTKNSIIIMLLTKNVKKLKEGNVMDTKYTKTK